MVSISLGGWWLVESPTGWCLGMTEGQRAPQCPEVCTSCAPTHRSFHSVRVASVGSLVSNVTLPHFLVEQCWLWWTVELKQIWGDRFMDTGAAGAEVLLKPPPWFWNTRMSEINGQAMGWELPWVRPWRPKIGVPPNPCFFWSSINKETITVVESIFVPGHALLNLGLKAFVCGSSTLTPANGSCWFSRYSASCFGDPGRHRSSCSGENPTSYTCPSQGCLVGFYIPFSIDISRYL